jgi:hypothetical protein
MPSTPARRLRQPSAPARALPVSRGMCDSRRPVPMRRGWALPTLSNHSGARRSAAGVVGRTHGFTAPTLPFVALLLDTRPTRVATMRFAPATTQRAGTPYCRQPDRSSGRQPGSLSTFRLQVPGAAIMLPREKPQSCGLTPILRVVAGGVTKDPYRVPLQRRTLCHLSDGLHFVNSKTCRVA